MREKDKINDIVQVTEFLRIADDIEKLFFEYEQKTHEVILQAHERLKDKGIDNYDILEQYKMDIFYFLTKGNDAISYYKNFRKYVEDKINKDLEEMDK